MPNKLKKLFSNDDLSFSVRLSFEDESSKKEFSNAMKTVMNEGTSAHSKGPAKLEASLHNNSTIFHTTGPLSIKDMILSPSRENITFNLSTEFGLRKLTLQKYATTTHLFLETPADAIVYIKTKLRLPTAPNSTTLPAARLTYRVQPENAATIQNLIESYSTAFAFIQKLFGAAPNLTTANDEAKYDQMQEFLSTSIQMFKKLLYIGKKFNVTFQPEQLLKISDEQEISNNWCDVEELYYLLETKKALHLSAKITESNTNGNLTASPLNDIKIGQKLEITYLRTAEYTIFGHSLTLYTANLLSNATVRQIEKISDSQIKILYGNDENNPMYISYTGFLTEEAAAEEMKHSMEHKEMYTKAPELREVREN